MWDERSTTRDREPVLLRDVLAATTAALQQASREAREARAMAAPAGATAGATAAEAVMPSPRCGECGAETRRAARAIPGRRARTGPGAAAGASGGACPNRSAA